MKIQVIVGIIVIIFALPIFGQDVEIQPWVKVEIFNTQVIKGEPIFVHIEKQGTPHAGDCFIDGQKCVERSTFGYVSHLAPGDVPQNQPPSDIRKWKEYSGYLRNICEDWRLKDMGAGKHELCYKDPLIEGCATFEIQEPVGVDLDVYNMLTPEMRDFTDAKSLRKTLLSKFPTSTYAGWVLKSISPGAIMGYSTAQEMLEDLKKPFKERKGRKGQGGHDPEGKPIWITPEEEAQKYIDLVPAQQ